MYLVNQMIKERNILYEKNNDWSCVRDGYDDWNE